MNSFESVNMNFLGHRRGSGHLWPIQVCADSGVLTQATRREQFWFSKLRGRVWNEHIFLNWSLLLTSSKHPLTGCKEKIEHKCFYWHNKICGALHGDRWRHNYICNEQVLLFFIFHCFLLQNKMCWSIINNIYYCYSYIFPTFHLKLKFS